MIKKNIRINNEFYVCPVYNEAINEGKKIVIDKEFVQKNLGDLVKDTDLSKFIL